METFENAQFTGNILALCLSIIIYVNGTYTGTDQFSFYLQNFQILLKQALVADRVDYVTVLLQEEHVQFDRHHFPYIYDKVMFYI